jgi:type III pantothenate kinase
VIYNNIWIALAIGNSRYHWAWFLNDRLQASWDTAYQAPALAILQAMDYFDDHQIDIIRVPIYLISVVPNQTKIWQQLPQVREITLADIPLFNLYSTIGIDRAIAIFGAGEIYDYPVLVIDGGTALTRHLVGGAIIPGLKLQFSSLSTRTAALPEVKLPLQLPPRWGNNTNDAIASGILYCISTGIVNFIDDWDRLYPNSQIVFTGGDGDYLKSILPQSLIDRVTVDRQLIFHGFRSIVVEEVALDLVLRRSTKL